MVGTGDDLLSSEFFLDALLLLGDGGRTVSTSEGGGGQIYKNTFYN